MFICKKCKKPSINEVCDDCKKRGDSVALEKGVNVKPRKPQTFIVFQGKGNGASFCTQMDNQIIWAPKCNEWGNTFPYWERIKELREGDKIFHAVAGYIVAVSVVKKAPTGETMPFPLDSKRVQLIPNLMGYFAKLDIAVLYNPISYKGYKDEILKCRAKNIGKGDFCDANDFPFTKYGGGQFGYLYHLPQELADLFER